jgi:SAM-dependent methyltransferase
LPPVAAGAPERRAGSGCVQGILCSDPAAASANVEQAEFWSQLAPTWLEFEDQLERVGGPPGELAMARLELLPGQRVLDPGCGSGRTTLELAARVGPGGEVVGVDISAGMLARARERAARSGTGNVEFVYADVQVHESGEARFDAAYSRFGVMFFVDPVAAFANIRKALWPGAVLSFVCWQSVFDNEWMLIPGAAVAGVTGSLPPMPGPDEPGPFSLADPGRVHAVLVAAGFGSVTVAPHDAPMCCQGLGWHFDGLMSPEFGECGLCRAGGGCWAADRTGTGHSRRRASS